MKVDGKSVRTEYHVVFTREEIAELTAASETHYDWACRKVASDGWLKAANNWLSLSPDEKTAGTFLGWTDLDILSKICESPIPALTSDTRHAVWQIFSELRDDTNRATDFVRTLKSYAAGDM